jgi:hypothetical protein
LIYAFIVAFLAEERAVNVVDVSMLGCVVTTVVALRAAQ